MPALTHPPHPQIEAVLGHELGHWKYGHTLIAFALSQTYALAMLYTFSFAIHTPALYASFGFDPVAAPVLVGLLLFSTVRHALRPSLRPRMSAP